MDIRRRSRPEFWNRLLTVFILLALAIGVVLLVGRFRSTPTGPTSATVAPSAKGSPATFAYSCCQSALVDTVYHPLSGPFTSVELLKTSIAGPHPRNAPATASAAPIRLSSEVAANPVSVLRLPRSAAPGYYNLAFTEATSNHGGGGASVDRLGGASIIRVAR
jgi:hypothetical protein